MENYWWKMHALIIQTNEGLKKKIQRTYLQIVSIQYFKQMQTAVNVLIYKIMYSSIPHYDCISYVL